MLDKTNMAAMILADAPTPPEGFRSYTLTVTVAADNVDYVFTVTFDTTVVTYTINSGVGATTSSIAAAIRLALTNDTDNDGFGVMADVLEEGGGAGATAIIKGKIKGAFFTVASDTATGPDYDGEVGSIGGVFARWKLDEASGNIIDVGPNSIDGVAVGSPSYAQAHDTLTIAGSGIDCGGGAQFTLGAPGDFDVLSSTTEWAISMWVRWDGAGAVLYTIMGNSISSANDGFWLYVDNRGLGPGSTLAFQLFGDGTSQLTSALLAGNIASGVPFFLTVVSSSSGCKIYVDGVDVTYASTAAVAKAVTGTGQMRLFARTDGGSVFDGQLDDVVIFDEALTPAQVASLYTAGTLVAPPSANMMLIGPADAAPSSTEVEATTNAIVGASLAVALNADQNNYNPFTAGAPETLLVLTPNASPRNITGIVPYHRSLILVNASTTNTIQLAHESGSSAAANQFSLNGATSFVIQPRNAAILVYDDINSKWRLVR